MFIFYNQFQGEIMNSFENKVVLITGGSSGIGYELARQMIDEKARVIICSRSEKKLKETKQKIPGVVTIQCDITQKRDRENLLKQVNLEHPDLNMFINNAGIVRRYWLQDVKKFDQWMQEEWQTNYFAPVLLIKEFYDLLKKNKGVFVNVSSGLAFVPMSIQPNYCATKAALHSMTQSIRHQLQPDGIRVVEVFPPAVDTPFQEGEAPPNSIGAEETAMLTIKGLKKQKDEIFIKRAALIYKLGRLMPQKAFRILNSVIPKNARERLRSRM